MSESVDSFLNSLHNSDLLTAITLLDKTIAAGRVDEFSGILERTIEQDTNLMKYQLRIRDCFAEYLGFGPIYFALLLPSYDIFSLVSGATCRNEAQTLLEDIVKDWVKIDDSRIDLTFLEIDSLVETPYVLLVPYLLSKRASELEGCKIPYSIFSSGNNRKIRYCLTELQQTHYGRKIVSAFNLDMDYLIIGDSDFQKIRETLQSYGLDVSSMLVEIPEENWPYSVMQRMRSVEQEYMASSELKLLYETYTAMIGLDSDNEEIRSDCLTRIEVSATKFCNDAVLSLLSNGPTRLRLKAVRLIESTRDHSTIDFLCSLIPETSSSFKEKLLRAISTIESAQYFIPNAVPEQPRKHEVVPQIQDPETIENYLAALNQLSKSSSTITRVDAVRALSVFRFPGVDSHLRRMMNDEDYRVRLAVLDACSGLPREQVFNIVRMGLHDEDASVEKRALQLFEERWPDSYW